MEIDWDKIATEVGDKTDKQFQNTISSLTRLNDNEIESLIIDTGISKQDLVKVLKEVHDASKSNEEKAKAIGNISKGLDILIGIANKLLL